VIFGRALIIVKIRKTPEAGFTAQHQCTYLSNKVGNWLVVRPLGTTQRDTKAQITPRVCCTHLIGAEHRTCPKTASTPLCRGLYPVLPLHLIVAALFGWLEREQHDVIEFLREENGVLKAQLLLTLESSLLPYGPRNSSFRPHCVHGVC
jgi:hypothetical protein